MPSSEIYVGGDDDDDDVSNDAVGNKHTSLSGGFSFKRTLLPTLIPSKSGSIASFKFDK